MASTDSAYFVAMPTSAVIHIQNTAPGPPSAMAAATPTMLPLPMVADSAVISDWNGVMSPFAPATDLRPRMSRANAVGMRRIGISPMPMVR